MRVAICFAPAAASDGVANATCDRNRPFTSASATVVCAGRISATRIARPQFNRKKEERRPLGNRPVGPLITHFSAISCSVIKDTVLRCNPETRARSAREMGCRWRIKFSTTLRLMSRAVSLDATCVLVKSSRRIQELTSWPEHCIAHEIFSSRHELYGDLNSVVKTRIKELLLFI